MHYKRLVALFSLVLAAPGTSAAIVGFNGGSNSSLPYSESGLTFSEEPGSSPARVVGLTDGYLTAGTNGQPIRITVTGGRAFDLSSLSIEGIGRSWKIESSVGAVVSPSVTGIVDVDGVAGWSGITSFQLIHDPGEANGFIRVDDIVFELVPEPSSMGLLALSSLVLFRRRSA